MGRVGDDLAAPQIFVGAAAKAGANLTPETWAKGLESLGPIELATTRASSFGPGKPDAQDSFQLMQFNPKWKANEGIQQFLPVGDPVTLTK